MSRASHQHRHCPSVAPAAQPPDGWPPCLSRGARHLLAGMTPQEVAGTLLRLVEAMNRTTLSAIERRRLEVAASLGAALLLASEAEERTASRDRGEAMRVGRLGIRYDHDEAENE